MVKQRILRHAGHPWFGVLKPNFDHMEVRAGSQAELDAFVERAADKFWQPWILGVCTLDDGTEVPGGLLYKPSGWAQAWIDRADQPHPGGHPPESSTQS